MMAKNQPTYGHIVIRGGEEKVNKLKHLCNIFPAHHRNRSSDNKNTYTKYFRSRV